MTSQKQKSKSSPSSRRPKRKRGSTKAERKTTDARDAKKVKQLELRRDVVTAAVEKAESRIEELDEAFCKPGFFEDTADSKIRAMQQDRDKLATDLEELMTEWETIEAALEDRS